MAIEINIDVLELMGTNLAELMGGLDSGEMNPEEALHHSSNLKVQAEEWLSHINGQLGRQ